MCCNSWGRKELDTTERLHFTSFHFNPLAPQDAFWAHINISNNVDNFQLRMTLRVGMKRATAQTAGI